MINISEVIETNQMIEKENLDVRTITLGISLLDCIDSDLQECKKKIYHKITTVAKDLVETGNKIETFSVDNEFIYDPLEEFSLYKSDCERFWKSH